MTELFCFAIALKRLSFFTTILFLLIALSSTFAANAANNDSSFAIKGDEHFIGSAAACTGIAANGDYSYEVYSDAGVVYFTFHPLTPIAGSTSAIIYLKEGTGTGSYPGYNMIASGSDFTFSKALADGTITSFYFSYNVPSGGERNSSADPHTYLAGTVCVAGAPNVSISAPADATSFTAPASVVITAKAYDLDGTIAKVDFYNGASLLGTAENSPYSFSWNNVAAGSYTLMAKATDNNGLETSSIPVHIVVNAANTDGYCGTAFNGDYEYKAETTGDMVTFTFHPLSPIAGCSYALIYAREGLTGGYPGYGMSASGTDFIFTKSIVAGTPVSFYFTYNIPSGGERNSSANPHSYYVGDNCTGITGTAPTVSITSPLNNAGFTEPATITITADAADADGTVSKVDFYSGAALLGTDETSPFSFDWANVPAGNYTLSAKATDNGSFSTISSLINVVVSINNAAGFCGTSDNGDYSYKVETVGENVIFRFHPLAPIQGCSYALVYIKEGVSDGYPGYPMTAIGADFSFTKSIASGTAVSIYFTYNVPSGGERNSSETPHSYIAGSICDGVLAIDLLDFNASLQAGGKVAIAWSAVTDKDHDYFLVERSNDGRLFTTLAKAGANNGAEIMHSYQVLDQWPFNGINYYRLTQFNKDGSSKVFGVKTVNNIGKRKENVIIYPNPLNGTTIHVKLPERVLNSLNVQLLGIAGKSIYSNMVMPQGDQISLTLPFKPARGLYLLVIQGYAPLKLFVE